MLSNLISRISLGTVFVLMLLLFSHGEAVAQTCGLTGQRECPVWVHFPSCRDDRVAFQGQCFDRNVCGEEGQRPCLVGENRTGCTTGLVESSGQCLHPPCGRSGENACAIVGRNSCDTGRGEFRNFCTVRNACGAEGQRPCLIGENKIGCATDFVESNGQCVHPSCGRSGEHACAIVGRNSCDVGLVEFRNFCAVRNACGAEGQRPCLVGENRTGCATDLVESSGQCVRPACGRNGEQACSIVGRNSCDVGLVEFNNSCAVRNDCGEEGQRLCLLGEKFLGCAEGTAAEILLGKPGDFVSLGNRDGRCERRAPLVIPPVRIPVCRDCPAKTGFISVSVGFGAPDLSMCTGGGTVEINNGRDTIPISFSYSGIADKQSGCIAIITFDKLEPGTWKIQQSGSSSSCTRDVKAGSISTVNIRNGVCS
jgi:hypothetical protein